MHLLLEDGKASDQKAGIDQMSRSHQGVAVAKTTP